MRKLIFSLFIISGLFAQMTVQAGLNMGDMRWGEDATEPDGKGMRLGGALAVHYPLGPVVANAGFTQRGMTASDGDITWAFDYLTFGFSFPYSISEGVLVSAGLGVNYLLSANAKFSGDFDGMEDEDLSETSASLDYGLELGLGYYFTENMGLGLEYYYGLADINEDTTEGYEAMNTGIQLSFLYGL